MSTSITSQTKSETTITPNTVSDSESGSIIGNLTSSLLTGVDALLAAPSQLQRLLGGNTTGDVASHVVKGGQTLSQIASDNGTTWQTLARLNNLSDPDRLSVGQVLRLPHTVASDTAGVTRNVGGQVNAVAEPVVRNAAASASGLSQKGMDFIYAHEAQRGVSNHLHWPKAASGVTLGPGYDMKGRTADAIVRDLTAIGVDRTAATQAAQGAKLTGAAARDFATANRDLINLTPQQEKALLARTVEPYAAHVASKVTVPLTQNQFDALTSFAYNIGTNGFDGSTALKRLNAGDMAGAAEAMSWWNKSDGQVVQGLVNRRADEVQLFNTPGAAMSRGTADTSATRSATNARTDADAVANTPADYARIVEARGDAQAKADLAAGKKVVVALRTPTATDANAGHGSYDDRIAVVWKGADGQFKAETFAGNTEPSAQYAYDGPRASKGSHTDMNGDGKMDLGRLQAGTIRYRQQADQFLGNTYFRATRTQVAERDTNQDGVFDAHDTNRVDTSGAGTSMLIHQGGVSNTYSAGCQTLAREQYNSFVRALGGQQAFSYVLVDAQ